MLRLIFCLTAVVLLAVACGGDDSAPGATPSPTATAATPTATPSGVSTPTAVPTQVETVTPAPNGQPYTVQRGDTLYSIAVRFGTTVDAISRANGISDPTQISVGQVLVIPVAGSPLPTETAAAGGAAQTLSRGDPDRMMVAFSFDAGSDAGYTAQILDTLAANGIHVSFGMTGAWAEQNPDLLRRIVNEGHSLINHSWSHPLFTDLSQEQRWDELDRTEAIINQLTGATTKPYFRPPFGGYDNAVLLDVGLRGYRYNVMWTVDSRGWQGISADEIVQRCLDQAVPGAIYVFHVGSASQDGPALQRVIDGLRAAGYGIGSVPDVIP